MDINLNFGQALEAVKNNKKASRKGWNGKGMYIYLQPGSTIERARNNHLDEIIAEKGSVVINPHIDMIAADDSAVIGWLASQTDMLADDWIIID